MKKEKKVLVGIITGVIGLVLVLVAGTAIVGGFKDIAGKFDEVKDVVDSKLKDIEVVQEIVEAGQEDTFEVESETFSDEQIEAETENQTENEIASETESVTETEVNKEKTTEKQTESSTKQSFEDWIASVGGVVTVTTTRTESSTTAPKPTLSAEEYAIQNDKKNYKWTPNESLHQKKVQWLREKYGDKFTCNGMEFVYEASYPDFIVNEKYCDVHLMTSATTSTIGYNYYKRRYYRVAEYLGYYGTDHALYNNADAFKYTYIIESGVDEGTTAPNAEATNEAYLLSSGWKRSERNEYLDNYEFISPVGVPAAVYESGYLKIYIKYSGDSEAKAYYFTIEEYNKFVTTHTWTVGSRTRQHYFSGQYVGTSQFKYLVVTN